MKRRTFALLTAVITFTVGVVAARLALPNLFKTPPPVITVEIIRNAQAGDYRITGPYEFSNLKIFLIHAPDAPDSLVYTSLQDAMVRDLVRVHETGDVNQIAIENVSEFEEVFVQAGDIVKGGNQDRVMAVDLVVPAKSGIVPIAAYCVEQSRWQARGAEPADHFTITDNVAHNALLQAIKDIGSQIKVWVQVKAAQEQVGAGVARNISSEESATSLPLALENDAVQEATAAYTKNLYAVTERSDDVIGFVFAINDEIKSGDVYSSNMMFKKFWHRLLKAAAVEAVASPPRSAVAREALSIETVGSFLSEAEGGEQFVTEVNERTQSVKRTTERSLFFESRDSGYGHVWIHRSYLNRIAN